MRSPPPWLSLPLALFALVGARRASSASADAGPIVVYRVVVGPAVDTLDVEATFPRGVGATFAVARGAAAFVSDLAVLEPRPSRPPAARGDTWTIPACAQGCRVRYRFALGGAAEGLADVDLAGRQGASIVSPPSTWLLRPTSSSPSRDRSLAYRLRVSAPAGLSLLTGLPAAPDGAYAGTLEGDFDAPYAVVGRFATERVAIGGAELTVAVATPALDADAPQIRRWIGDAARAVTAYYGRFPVAHALVIVVTKDEGVFGKEMGGGGGASVLLEIAPGAKLDDPSSIWMATHELVHLSVPNMNRDHTWLTEGLATYVEPIARAQAGELPATAVWRDALHGMPNGLPARGDRGLDRTPTWGRTYWGGALFCLMADVEIAQRTHGRKSLQDALRGALAAGQDTTVARTPEQFFAAADRAIGVPGAPGVSGAPILAGLYARWARTPVPVDLVALWRKLGVAESPRGVALDDGAPLAGLRRSLTTAR